jgi:hypothetical protein
MCYINVRKGERRGKEREKETQSGVGERRQCILGIIAIVMDSYLTSIPERRNMEREIGPIAFGCEVDFPPLSGN